MSYVNAAPQLMARAAAEVAGIGSAIDQAHGVAAPATTFVLPAAADEVSAAVAAFFSESGQSFSDLGAKAAAFHSEFANLLNGGAGQYLDAEIASAQQMSAPVVNAAARNESGQPGWRNGLFGGNSNGGGSGQSGSGNGNLSGNAGGTGSGLSGLANGILSGTPSSQNFSTMYGPFTISGTQTVTPAGQGFAGTTNASVALGVAPVLTGNAIENFSLATGLGTATFSGEGPFFSFMGNASYSLITGGFSANVAGTAPLLAVGLSVNGTYPLLGGTGTPHITSTALQIDGIQVPSQFITSTLNSIL
ncbi:MAG: PE family protein [Mycobacterium sp.]